MQDHPKSPLTLLSLPKELRDKILTSCLVSFHLIHICRIQQGWYRRRGQDGIKFGWDWGTNRRPACTKDLALPLLYVGDAQLAADAARILYRHNMFHFDGNHGWGVVLAWLDAIGPVNRTHVRRLRCLIVTDPRLTVQAPALVPTIDWKAVGRELWACAPDWVRRRGLPPEYEMERVVPLVEMLFGVLGRSGNGPSVRLTLCPLQALWRCVPLDAEHLRFEDARRHQEVFAQLVEVFEMAQRTHTGTEERRNVEIEWEWCGYDESLSFQEYIAKQDWVVAALRPHPNHALKSIVLTKSRGQTASS